MIDRSRSVSPLGASRFERPYAARPLRRSKHRPPAADLAARDGLVTSSAAHGKGRSLALPSFSPVFTLPDEIDADEWFARFRSDPDLRAPTSDACPDRATLAAVRDLPVFSADGRSRPFGELYEPASALHQRQLVCFVRHFYCGACQAFLRVLTAGIPLQDYFCIPIPTSVIVVGCGEPDLIPQYKKFTGCPFPIYADPSRTLFRKLAMTVSLNVGARRPQYMKDIGPAAWAAGQMKTIRRSLRDPKGIRKRDILRGGNPLQIGGEFLFEDGDVVWCHRMKNYRDHTEVATLRKLLDLDDT